jgi:hypothetical protein
MAWACGKNECLLEGRKEQGAETEELDRSGWKMLNLA